MHDLLGGKLRERVPFASYLFYRTSNDGRRRRGAHRRAAGRARAARSRRRTASPSTSSRAACSRRTTSWRATGRWPRRCRATGCATTPTACCRSPRRGGSGRPSATCPTTTTRTRPGGSTAMRQLRDLGIPLATNTVVVNFEQLATNVRDPAVDVDPAGHHVLGRHPGLRQGGGVCETFQLGVAVHSSGELGIQLATMLHLGAVLPNLSYAADAHYHHLPRRRDRRRQDVLRGRRDRGAVRPGAGRPARPGQGGRVRRALPGAGRLPVRPGPGPARLVPAGAQRPVGRPRDAT